ncbi:MAG: glycosyltransferase, partial [Cyanobacteria bacterium P01_C01_bin.72]
QAELHYRQAIAIAPISTVARSRLATILMLTGRINEAREQFQLATAELNRKTPPGKVAVPLRSHPAMVTNELRINPPLLKKLQLAQQIQGYDRILELGSLLTLEPTYLGTSLYLARDLRQQGIFAGIEKALSQNPSNYPTIPKRIVQFWDEPEPPAEITRVCQSWLDHNPDYEYTRFSLNTAIAFLHEHYDKQVFKAFKNCDQPATQADFFRLAYLNKMGGFYADADDLCRQSLDWLVELQPELVVLQEDFSCIGNNFIGCIPGQTMIRTAFYQAVHNLAEYCNEGPWFKTGPGLMTSVVASALVPYLTYTDYRMYPRLLVLSQTQLRKQINQHLSLAYKRSEKSWHRNAYYRRVITA